jgi:hypothetical protein
MTPNIVTVAMMAFSTTMVIVFHAQQIVKLATTKLESVLSVLLDFMLMKTTNVALVIATVNSAQMKLDASNAQQTISSTTLRGGKPAKAVQITVNLATHQQCAHIATKAITLLPEIDVRLAPNIVQHVQITVYASPVKMVTIGMIIVENA